MYFINRFSIALFVLLASPRTLISQSIQGVYQGNLVIKHNVLIIKENNSLLYGQLYLNEKNYLVLSGNITADNPIAVRLRGESPVIQLDISMRNDTLIANGIYDRNPVSGWFVRKSTNPEISVKKLLTAMVYDPDVVGDWKLVAEQDKYGNYKTLSSELKNMKYYIYSNGIMTLSTPELEKIRAEYGTQFKAEFSWRIIDNQFVKSANPKGMPAYESRKKYTVTGDTLTFIAPSGLKSYLIRISKARKE